jgi:hypothetical protein
MNHRGGALRKWIRLVGWIGKTEKQDTLALAQSQTGAEAGGRSQGKRQRIYFHQSLQRGFVGRLFF